MNRIAEKGGVKMNSNIFKHHGCGGGCGQTSNFCPPNGTGNNGCRALGPFTAVNAACIIPPANTGSVIPFASGVVPVTLTTILGGLVSRIIVYIH